MNERWSDPDNRTLNEYGTKTKSGNINSPGHRENPNYSDWHRTIGRDYYANDVDWLEWRIGPEGPQVVALIELTYSENTPGRRYCDVALARFKRDGQYTITKMVSQALEVPAFFVIARYDLEVFCVCRLSNGAWSECDEPRYRKWIQSL